MLIKFVKEIKKNLKLTTKVHSVKKKIHFDLGARRAGKCWGSANQRTGPSVLKNWAWAVHLGPLRWGCGLRRTSAQLTSGPTKDSVSKQSRSLISAFSPSPPQNENLSSYSSKVCIFTYCFLLSSTSKLWPNSPVNFFFAI